MNLAGAIFIVMAAVCGALWLLAWALDTDR